MSVIEGESVPRNAIVVLLDSLNRHMIGAYGGTEFDTPNLDRFARRALRFDRHVTGSLPCIPARHDILCGALDFLWRPWGSIEVWEEPLTYSLRRAGVTTMLVSDHPHLFESGGENYHTDFAAWEYVRGHENDPWKSRPDPSWLGTPALPAATGAVRRNYDDSRTYFREESDFPGPRTMQAAADWLDQNAESADRFFLFVDEFDPHEPFDTPLPWARRYDPDWEGDLLIWPPYAIGAIANGVVSEREAQHIRSNYGAKLSMIDHWLGKILDVLDAKKVWDDTVVMICTDHGHYLGERDLFGKPKVPQFEPLGHVPFIVAWPRGSPGSTEALTTSVDIYATLADLFGVSPRHTTHGRSLLPLLERRADSVREWAVGGVFGQWVQINDGRRKYARAPMGSGFPLSLWSNRWSTMPLSGTPHLGLPRPDRRARLDFMPGSDVPVIRQPFQPGDLLPYWALDPQIGQHHCYNFVDDPDEIDNRLGTVDEKDMTELLREALRDLDAPTEQSERLGLA